MSTAKALGFEARPSESASLTSGVSHRVRGRSSSGGGVGGLAQTSHASSAMGVAGNDHLRGER